MLPRTVRLPTPLRDEHRQVFDLLLEVNRSRNVGAVLRVAGGWVRDALLGRPSNDIDVAIESTDGSHRHITGEVFAREISAYQEATAKAAAAAAAAEATAAAPLSTSTQAAVKQPTISVIKVNPEKSKHIETAQLTVLNIPLEFCHLRHDAYCAVTRVPTVRPGTPLEDALRRDYTVNALFYNLHTQLVEDYTTGLDDLQSCVLRCPLDPRETFLDDPLRMLRGVRFSGQLGFRLDASILRSVDDELLIALEQKVSRERFGIEWQKMMGGSSPGTCWTYLQEMRLDRVLMQELYLAKAKSKTASGIVERVGSLLPCDEQQQESIHAQWDASAATVMPLLASPSSAVYQAAKDDRAMMAMFLLALPAMQTSTSEERAERLAAWSTNGLKLPVALSTGIRKMLDAVEALWRQPEAVELLIRTSAPFTADEAAPGATTAACVWIGSLRDTLFDALLFLSDRAVPRTALPVVIAATLVSSELSRNMLLATVTLPSALSSDSLDKRVARAMAALESDPGQVLLSTQCALPIRGDEIPKLLEVPSKETGRFLLMARRYCLHNKHATREDVVAFLAHQKNQP